MGKKRTIQKNVEAEKVLLFDAFEEFVEMKEAQNLAAATIKNYQQSFNYFVEFNEFDAETEANEVALGHILKWQKTLLLEGDSVSSVNHYLRDCRAFLYWCMDESRKYIDKAFKIQLVTGQEEMPKAFSDEDIDTLLEKPKRNEGFVAFRTWAVVSWVMATGNRAATVCEVKIGDINFKQKEISLRHTKNKKAQIIPLSSSLETVLKDFIRMWRKEAGKDDWLFCDIGEDQLTTNALRHSFNKYCKDRGVEQTNIHGLRHTFAKGWIRNNGNIYTLQKVLGHSSLEMTRKYVKLFAEDIKEGYDRFSPLDTVKRSARRTKTVKRSDEF